MRHEGDGFSLAVQLLENHHDFVTGAGIQVSGGFVCENDHWVVHQGAGDCDSLLLAARKLVRQVVHATFEPDHL